MTTIPQKIVTGRRGASSNETGDDLGHFPEMNRSKGDSLDNLYNSMQIDSMEITMTMDKATADAQLAAFVAEINEHDKKIVNEFGETTKDLAAAFKRVENVEHWKYPISCVLPKATKTERERITRAIAFYTGSVAKWEKLKATGWRVTAAGYFKTIGA